MGIFHIYVDESGKTDGKDNYTSLCGYVGPVVRWEKFAQLWEACRFEWQIPPVHMSRIMQPNLKEDAWSEKCKEWGEGWMEKRNTFLHELGVIIHNSGIICVGAVVDANAYRIIQAESDSALVHKDSNVFALHEIIMEGLEVIETVDLASPVSLILDDDPAHAKEYYDHLANLRIHPNPLFAKVKQRIHALSFCDDEHYPGLQAADMMAWSARRWMLDCGEDHKISQPPELLKLLTHSGMYQPVIYKEDVLRKLAAKNIASRNDESKTV